jgi:hypothetical protein
MSSKSGWRRFLPGKRKNRREDRVIQAISIPISEGGPLLREEETDPETQGPYPGQQQYVASFATHTHRYLISSPVIP